MLRSSRGECVYVRWVVACRPPTVCVPVLVCVPVFVCWLSHLWWCKVHMRFSRFFPIQINGFNAFRARVCVCVCHSLYTSIILSLVRISFHKIANETNFKWQMNGERMKKHTYTQCERSTRMSCEVNRRRHAFALYVLCAPWWFSVNLVFTSSPSCVAFQTKWTNQWTKTHTMRARNTSSQMKMRDMKLSLVAIHWNDVWSCYFFSFFRSFFLLFNCSSPFTLLWLCWLLLLALRLNGPKSRIRKMNQQQQLRKKNNEINCACAYGRSIGMCVYICVCVCLWNINLRQFTHTSRCKAWTTTNTVK